MKLVLAIVISVFFPLVAEAETVSPKSVEAAPDLACQPNCTDEEKVFYDKLKTIKKLEPSKKYKISGRVISVDEVKPYGGPPMENTCYQLYKDTKYNLVTMQLSSIEPEGEGAVYPPIDAQGVMRFVFAVRSYMKQYTNFEGFTKLGHVDNIIKQSDSFSALAQFSGNECISEVWLENLELKTKFLEE